LQPRRMKTMEILIGDIVVSGVLGTIMHRRPVWADACSYDWLDLYIGIG
jgi:hypothetical protein